MPQRVTIVMGVTTAPPDRSKAVPHSGGWSESFWRAAEVPADDPATLGLAAKRATILPSQAQVTGVRVENFIIAGNKLTPTGSSSISRLFPGSAALDTDLPQVALELSGAAAGAINKARPVLRCMPDDSMKFGEYQPDPALAGKVTGFCNLLVQANWQFLGRDLTLPKGKVLGIAGGILVTDVNLTAVVGDSIIFNRVYDTDGRVVRGSFRVTAVPAANTYTLAFPGTPPVVEASGTCRKDVNRLFSFGSCAPKRAVVKKVGRPSEGYRGRQSKKKA